jgi:hypothetical protein
MTRFSKKTVIVIVDACFGSIHGPTTLRKDAIPKSDAVEIVAGEILSI